MKDTIAKYSLLVDLFALVMILVVGILGYFIGYGHGRRSVVPTEVVKTDTIRTTDTVMIPAPPPEVITKTEIKEVKVPVYIATTDSVVDSIPVQLPFEQHFTRLEDVADLWYSGFQAKIDSAKVYRHQQTIIEQHYVKQPDKSNIIGIEAGAKDASIMYMRQIGSFYVGISAGATYEGTATAKGIVGFRF